MRITQNNKKFRHPNLQSLPLLCLLLHGIQCSNHRIHHKEGSSLLLKKKSDIEGYQTHLPCWRFHQSCLLCGHLVPPGTRLHSCLSILSPQALLKYFVSLTLHPGGNYPHTSPLAHHSRIILESVSQPGGSPEFQSITTSWAWAPSISSVHPIS